MKRGFLAFLLILVSPAQAQTSVCMRKDMLSQCFEQLQSLLRNTSAFWYGSAYRDLCPTGGNSENPLCYNPANSTDADSIASRMFGNQNYNFSGLSQFVSVHYFSPGGQYTGCGNTFLMPEKQFDIDPLTPYVSNGWETRITPSVTWAAEPGLKYTLLMYDAAPYILHGLYINIPEGNMTAGEAIQSYRSVGNPFPRANTYIFALFRQNGPLNTTEVRSFINNSSQFLPVAFIRQFSTLQGPIGINLMLARSDALTLNRAPMLCAYLVKDDLAKYSQKFAQNLSPRVNVNITFSSEQINFTVCCKKYNIGQENIRLNPLSGDVIKSVYLRDKPSVDLYAINASYYSTNRLFTLMLVDAKSNQSTPADNSFTVHWQVINIPNSELNRGKELLSYLGAVSLEPGIHNYIYLLYVQIGNLDINIPPTYAGACSGHLASLGRRCNFRLLDFTTDNNLSLVGANWQLVTLDEYIRYNSIKSGLVTEAEACQGAYNCA